MNPKAPDAKRTQTIRIWDGCKVVALISVNSSGMTSQGGVGGAHDSIKVDIEMDPWAGLIVDHSVNNPPQLFREDQP